MMYTYRLGFAITEAPQLKAEIDHLQVPCNKKKNARHFTGIGCGWAETTIVSRR